MKKQVIAYLLLLLIGAQLLVQFGYMKADAKGPSVIPKEAVRLRILANSDSDKDQALKRKVRDEVKAQIDGWVADLTSFEEARKVIQSHIPEIEKTVANTLKKEGSKDSFQVKFSKNVKFPTKVYGNFIYSLVFCKDNICNAIGPHKFFQSLLQKLWHRNCSLFPFVLN